MGLTRGFPSSLMSLLPFICCCSVAKLCPTIWTAAHQASLFFTISHSLLRLMCVKSVMPPNHLILCHHLLPLPSIFPSIKVFSNELALGIKQLKYWCFSFSIIHIFNVLDADLLNYWCLNLSPPQVFLELLP